MALPTMLETFLIESDFKKREGLEEPGGAIATLHHFQEMVRASRDVIDREYAEGSHKNKTFFLRSARERIQFYCSDEEAMEGWYALQELQPGKAKELLTKLRGLRDSFKTLNPEDPKACADAKFALDMCFTVITVTTAKVLELYKQEAEADGIDYTPYEQKAAELGAWLNKKPEVQDHPETDLRSAMTNPRFADLMKLFDKVKALVDKDKEYKN